MEDKDKINTLTAYWNMVTDSEGGIKVLYQCSRCKCLVDKATVECPRCKAMMSIYKEI